MAIEKDFNLEVGRAPSAEALLKLVQEPSYDVIRRFGEDFQSLNHEHTPPKAEPITIGKFVAFHNFLLIAPYPRLILHRYIALGRSDLTTHIDLALETAREEGVQSLTDEYSIPTRLTDAGWFEIDNKDDGPLKLSIFGQSEAFNRADEEGRERTVGFFRSAVKDISVENDEY